MEITILYNTVLRVFQQRPSSDMAAFREAFAKSKHIVVLTGAGVSAESGVPTFRGAGGLWRQYRAQVGVLISADWRDFNVLLILNSNLGFISS